jgi:ERF superfamily
MNDEPSNLPAVPTTPFEMLSRAVAQGADPATLERLLAMYERWEANEARKAYQKAIAAARGKIKPVFKNLGANLGSGRRPYEDLAEIERSVVPALSANGLSYRFKTELEDGQIIVTCYVEHKDGHFEQSTMSSEPDNSGSKSPIQAIGSAVTYLKRITLKAALGLSTTDQKDVDLDDDGAGGEEEKITAEELVQLRARIAEAGQTEKRVCEEPAIDIARLEDLPRDKFEPVMNRLAINVRKRKEKDAAAQRGMDQGQAG